MIWQKQPDNSLKLFEGGKITNGVTVESVSLATAHIWSEKDTVRLHTWNLFNPVQVDIKPRFDSKTEFLEGPVTVVTETTITRTWTKKAKTPEQINDDETSVAEDMSDITFLSFHDIENKIRELQTLAGQDKPPVDEVQMRDELKSLVR